METAQTFRVRINDGPEQEVTVGTGVYMLAAVAALAILDVEWEPPISVEIWNPHLLPEYGPYHYLIKEDKYGGIVVSNAIPDWKLRQLPPSVQAHILRMNEADEQV